MSTDAATNSENFFPIIVYIPKGNEIVVWDNPEQIEFGTSFVVLQTNVTKSESKKIFSTVISLRDYFVTNWSQNS